MELGLGGVAGLGSADGVTLFCRWEDWTVKKVKGNGDLHVLMLTSACQTSAVIICKQFQSYLHLLRFNYITVLHLPTLTYVKQNILSTHQPPVSQLP